MLFSSAKQNGMILREKGILLPPLNIISRMWGYAMPSLTSDSRKKTILWRTLFTTSCQRYYIQSAFAIPDSSKMQQEQKSLVHIGDFFKKIIVVKDRIKLWRNEEGIAVMGIMDFLLKPNSLEL